jgi:hypothetical protein
MVTSMCETAWLLRLCKAVFLGLGLLLGVIAACIWYIASTAKVRQLDKRYYVGGEICGDDPDHSGQPIWPISTAMKQSRFNKIAAIFTAPSVFFQALAALAELLSLW